MTHSTDMRRLLDLVTRTLCEDAWHGSPHHFDRFTLSKIGSGEGAQVYGWGLYFTGTRGIAEFYRDQLSRYQEPRPVVGGKHIIFWFTSREMAGSVENMIPNYYPNRASTTEHLDSLHDEIREYAKYLPGSETNLREGDAFIDALRQHGVTWRRDGRLYKVEIPDDADYLRWDDSFAEQPPHVRAALEELIMVDRTPLSPELQSILDDPEWDDLLSAPDQAEPEAFSLDGHTGKQLYQMLAGKLMTPKAASLALSRQGVAGIKYLDGNSRVQIGGTVSFNYVMFDEAMIRILGTE